MERAKLEYFGERKIWMKRNKIIYIFFSVPKLIEILKMNPFQLECGVCGFKCKSNKFLVHHKSRSKKCRVRVPKKDSIRSKNKSEEGYSCQYCNFSTLQKCHLNNHQRFRCKGKGNSSNF